MSNVTLSGLTKSNLNGNTLTTITIANSIVDCNIYDCSCVLSSAVKSELMLYVNNGVRNCHISGIHGFHQLIRISYGLYYCLVEDFSCPLYTSGGNNAFIQTSARGCIFRRIFSPLVFIQGNGAGLFDCILDEISGTGTSFRNDYNYENTINCLFIGCKGFRSYMAALGIAKNNIFCGCKDTNSTYANLYRCPGTTAAGTSALNLVAMNNIFDVPISQCRDFQTAINNNGVVGKYAYTSGNRFNIPISAMGFVDIENRNYRLRSDSPLISAGTNFTDFVHTYKNTFPNNQLDMDGVKFRSENPSVGPYQSTAPFKPGNIPIDQYPLG